MKTISDTGVALIARFEGCRLLAYDDLQPHVVLTTKTPIKGTLTIGFGHTGSDVYIGKTITQKEAEELLKRDLAKFIAFVNNPYYVPLTDKLNQNQFDALVSFAMNTGQVNLKKLCENRTLAQIGEKIPLYTKSKGQVLTGLIRRRQAEMLLYQKSMEVSPVETPSLESRLEKAERRIVSLESEVVKLQSQLKLIPAPQWVVEEFPDIVNLLSEPLGTYEFWRAITISMRVISGNSGK